MKKIWIIRHGESLSQVDNSIPPLNPGLSNEGIIQAKQLKRYVESITPQIVLISPLLRSIQTYQLSFSKYELGVYDKRLVESDWGKDTTYTEALFDNLPKIAKQDYSNSYIDNAINRCDSVINSIQESTFTFYLLYSHRSTINHLINRFWQRRREDYITLYPDNASISLIELNDVNEPQLIYFNEKKHIL